MCSSEVFRAMVDRHSKDQQHPVITISDFKPDVFRGILLAIYSDDLPQPLLDANARDMLVAADMYNLPRLLVRLLSVDTNKHCQQLYCHDKLLSFISLLQAICEQALANQLTVENCCEMVTFAAFHNAHQLKSSALSFASTHSSLSQQLQDLLATEH